MIRWHWRLCFSNKRIFKYITLLIFCLNWHTGAECCWLFSVFPKLLRIIHAVTQLETSLLSFSLLWVLAPFSLWFPLHERKKSRNTTASLVSLEFGFWKLSPRMHYNYTKEKGEESSSRCSRFFYFPSVCRWRRAFDASKGFRVIVNLCKQHIKKIFQDLLFSNN